MSILTVTLNPAIDRMIRLDKIIVGKDHRVLSVKDSAGGKGVNVARALRGLGVRADSLTFLDESPDGVRVNTTVMDARGRVMRFMEPGVVASRLAQEQFIRKFKTCVKSYRYVVIAGSLPPRMKPSYLVALIEVVKKQGAWVAVDTSGVALKAAIESGVDLIKPNREEAQDFLGMRLSSRKRISKALRTLAGCGIKDILVSLGEDGLAGFDGVNEFFAQAPVVAAGPMVGCGDAALAGFLAGRLAGRDFKGCVRHAAACGALAAREFVPGRIVGRDVKDVERGIIFDKE
ncbi:MAG: PfkB family carbohydrate kinase [Candidatus Omnitrophota bacterium]